MMIDEKFYKIFYPKQVVLLTSCDRDGKPNIATIAWHMPVSIEPPQIAVSIGKARHTKKLLEATGEFVLNIIGEELKQKAKLCGNTTGKRSDKFSSSGLTPEPSMQVRPPCIKEALACVECKVVASYDASDHVIYVGEVVGVRKQEEFEAQSGEAAGKGAGKKGEESDNGKVAATETDASAEEKKAAKPEEKKPEDREKKTRVLVEADDELVGFEKP